MDGLEDGLEGAAGKAVQQELAATADADTERRRSPIVMRWAEGEPAIARPPAAASTGYAFLAASWTPGTAAKWGLRFDTDDTALVKDGALAGSDNTGGPPAGLATLRLGHDVAGNHTAALLTALRAREAPIATATLITETSS